MRQARGQKSPLKNHFRPEFQLEFLKNSNVIYKILSGKVEKTPNRRHCRFLSVFFLVILEFFEFQ